jgi:hypothetical protein
MQSTTVLRGLAASALLGSLVLAHHVSTPLSVLQGPDVLSSITYYVQQSSFGVAPHQRTLDEVDHHASFDLSGGASFLVDLGAGEVPEQLALGANEFVQPGAVHLDALLAALNAKSQKADFFDANGYVFARGQVGGASAQLGLQEISGSLLVQLGFPTGLQFGSDALQLELSIPAPGSSGAPAIDLGGRPYLLLASTSTGSFTAFGKQIPLALDASLTGFLDAALGGLLPGFVGVLDAQADGQARIEKALFQSVPAEQLPNALHLAYVVLKADLSGIDFVSNRFTVSIQK